MKRIKEFFCFYLLLPIFVFGILLSGAEALGEVQASNESPYYADITERILYSTSLITDEISNPDGTIPIVARDLSGSSMILNSTDEEIDEEKLLSLPLPHGEEEPLVLVVHTHGTECYADSTQSFSSADIDGNYGFYTESSATRSTDTNENVVAIGEVFCKSLADKGIPTIQCRIMHDKDDYNSAYANSRKSILSYLKKYPSIKYIIDLHRDSLGGEGENKIKTVAGSIDGCAQVMLVAGCNGKGVTYPLWKENLALALKYKKVMDEKYPSLSRPIYLRYSRYNLDLLEGSLLLEVGSCGNTFEEAKKAAELAAECFAQLLE